MVEVSEPAFRATVGHVGDQQRVSDVAGGFGSFSKVFRMALQSAVLGVGGLDDGGDAVEVGGDGGAGREGRKEKNQGVRGGGEACSSRY